MRLDTSRGQGVSATLTLPAHLLTTEAVTSAPVTPPHGHRVLPRAATPGLGPAAGPAPGPAGIPDAPTFPPMPASPVAMPTADAVTGSFSLPSGPAPSAAPNGPPRRPEPARGAWAPTPPGEPPLTGGPRTTRVPDTGLGRTPGGLARRTPLPADRPSPAPTDDHALLQALGRYAPSTPPTRPPGPAPATRSAPTDPAGVPPLPSRRPAGPPPAAPSPTRPPLGGTRGGSGGSGPDDGLARRVPGAQLPQAGVVPLRRTDSGATPAVPAPAPSRNDPRPTPAGGASRATDVQTLLSSFTAGVQTRSRRGPRALDPPDRRHGPCQRARQRDGNGNGRG